MKSYKFQNDNMCNKATKVGLFLFFSFYSCMLVNIQAQMTVCKGSTVELVPPTSNGTVVEWKDQTGNALTRLDEKGIRITDLTPKVTPTANTTYTVRQVDALNLISFGSFDPTPVNPDPSTLSDYDYVPVPRNFVHNYDTGFFSILDNPQELWDSTKYSPNNPDIGWRTNWYRSIGDHTTGHGNMFVANGAGGNVVFKSTIKVTAGTTYYVGAWFANINVNFTNPYNMDIYVKNEKIGSLSGSNNDNWYQKYAFWTATATEYVKLEFRNTQRASDGNDFAIDDIVFSPVVESTVDIMVNNPSDSTITASLCSGEDYVFNGKVYNVGGTYSDTLVNSVGCDSIITLVLKVGASTSAPVVNQTICSGDSIVFYGNTYKTEGTYEVHLNNSIGCDSLAILVLNVNPILSAEISGESFLCKDSIAPNILFKGEGGIAPYTFTYKINGGTNKYITTTYGDTVSIKAPTENAGLFTYKLVSVVDANGCEYSQNDSLTFSVEVCQTYINIPNAFTPNNDGFNDTFGPETVGIKEIKISINDRNGRLVFTIDSVNGRWDGLMKSGEPAPVGVYFYKYDAVGTNNKSYTNQGSVSLFRELIDTTPVILTPNPVRGNVKVNLSEVSGTKNISIYDAFGRKINEWNTSDDTSEFDSSWLQNGLYILKVDANNQVVFIKFIKQ